MANWITNRKNPRKYIKRESVNATHKIKKFFFYE